MKRIIGRTFVAAILAATMSVNTGARTHGQSIVVVFPSHLPEIAQRNSEAMYLHYTGDGRAVLYIEQDQGRTLGILDVADPAAIRALAPVSIAARSPYDFVETLRDSPVLIQYRDQSGFAVINLKKFKKPVLTEAPQFQHPGQMEALEYDGLLLAFTTRSSTGVEDSQYEVLDISRPSNLERNRLAGTVRCWRQCNSPLHKRQVDAEPRRFDSPIQFNVRDDTPAVGYALIRPAILLLAFFSSRFRPSHI